MKTIHEILKAAEISKSGLFNILSGRRRASWDLAKRLAESTGTTPDLWLDGKPDERRAAIFEPDFVDPYRSRYSCQDYENQVSRSA